MGTAVKIIRWIAGILIILMGISSLTDSAVATCFLWILAGALLLPPVTSKIPSFKKRKVTLILCCTVLIWAGGFAAPETEDAVQDGKDMAKESGKTEHRKDESSKKVLSKEDISNWINSELADEESKIAEEDIKKWENTNQGEFYKFWRKAVIKHIKGWENVEDYEKTAGDITKACSMYKKICGSGKEIETLLRDAETVSVLTKDNEKIKAKYNFDILSDRDKCSFNTYYIERQLEMAYSDNLAGKLQEEVDSYQPKEYLDWLVYDVDYWMDEPVCGDTCQMVLRTNTSEPFESAGAYYLAYIDTGETMTLRDSRGFSQKVPVCRMLGDGNIVENEFSQYISNIDTCFSLCQEIEACLKTGKLESSQENTISEANTDSNESLPPADDEDDLADIGQYYMIAALESNIWA